VHASVAWSNLTLADSNKLKIYKESWQIDAAVDFSTVMSRFCYLIIRIVRNHSIPVCNISVLLFFLLLFPRTKSTVVLLLIPLVAMNPLSNLDTLPPFMSVMSQDLAFSRGVLQLLHTPSANLQTFLIDTLSPLRILFPF
jgi:hypothetical protein